MPKRSASGSGTIRQRKDGTWEARYTTGRNPGTGKQVQKSVYGKTQREVRQKLTAATAAIDTGAYAEPTKLTVGAWLDIWLDEYVISAVKPGTYHSYKRICNCYIKPSLSATCLSALNSHSIQSFCNGLLKGTSNANCLSAKTVRNVHGVLHKALTQAVMINYLRFNPADACTLPRVVKKDIQPLSETQIAMFLESVSGHEHERVLVVTLFTGMRQSEALGLQWDCVDFAHGRIIIKRQLLRDYENGGYYVDTVKNNKARVIAPAPYVMDVLRSQKEEQVKLRLHAGEAWENGADYVFTNGIGQHLKHVTVYKNYKRLVESIGASTARFHDLRHSYVKPTPKKFLRNFGILSAC